MSHFADELIEKLVGFIVRWIDDWVLAICSALYLIRPGSARELRISNQPRPAVTRNVELRHHADATVAGVVEEFANFCLRVVQALRAVVREASEIVCSRRESLRCRTSANAAR